jgi:hypothetical protein
MDKQHDEEFFSRGTDHLGFLATKLGDLDFPTNSGRAEKSIDCS